MDFSLSQDELEIQDLARDFVRRNCPRDVRRADDEAARSPAAIAQELGRLGMWGIAIPGDLGGLGLGPLAACLVAEETAAAYPALGSFYARTAIAAPLMLETLAAEATRDRLLSGIAAGEVSIALAPAPLLRLAEDGGLARVTGETGPLPFCHDAQWCVAQAEGMGDAGVLLPLPSLEIEELPAPRFGYRGAGYARLCCDGLPVPPGNVLRHARGEGAGRRRIEGSLALAEAAVAVGIARGATAYARAYAEERTQFGQPIVRFEAVGQRLLDREAEIASARLLVQRAAWEAQTEPGQDGWQHWAFMARDAAAAAARGASLQAVQTLGGMGYMLEMDAQLYLRDAFSQAGTDETESLRRSLRDPVARDRA